MAIEIIKEETYTVEQLLNAGGAEWQKNGMHRVYFNDLGNLLGLDVGYYKSGNVSGAELNGERISNSEAKRILGRLAPAKVWYEVDAAEFRGKDISRSDMSRIVEGIENKIPEVA